MENKNSICKKIASVLKTLIGISLAICLFVGGLGLIGYIIAFCIGGETATEMCTWIYKTFYVFLIKLSTITTVFCFIYLYLNGNAKWVNPFKAHKNS